MPRKAPTNGVKFKPGQSGNPSGFSKERRTRLQEIAEALDKAFAPEGNSPDKLINVIVIGVLAGNVELIKLAAQYRWGRPPQEISLANDSGTPLIQFVLPTNGREGGG